MIGRHRVNLTSSSATGVFTPVSTRQENHGMCSSINLKDGFAVSEELQSCFYVWYISDQPHLLADHSMLAL